MELTVIEGLGHRDSGWTRSTIHEFAIDIMRAIVRGNDHRHEVQDDILCLINKISVNDIEILGELTDAQAKKLNTDIFGRADDVFDLEVNDVIRVSMEIAANRACHDNAAPARAAKLKESLLVCVQRLGRRLSK